MIELCARSLLSAQTSAEHDKAAHSVGSNFEKYEPGHLYVGPILRLKFSSKSGFVKLTLYSTPTLISILYLTSPSVALTGGVKEAC